MMNFHTNIVHVSNNIGAFPVYNRSCIISRDFYRDTYNTFLIYGYCNILLCFLFDDCVNFGMESNKLWVRITRTKKVTIIVSSLFSRYIILFENNYKSFKHSLKN